MGMLSRALSREPKRVTVTLDEGVHAALLEVAKIRETSIETIMDLQLLGYIRSAERGRIIELQDLMPYGQYKGALLEDVIKVNPRYIQYLLSNSDTFRISEEAIKLLNKLDDHDEYITNEKPAKDINDE